MDGNGAVGFGGNNLEAEEAVDESGLAGVDPCTHKNNVAERDVGGEWNVAIEAFLRGVVVVLFKAPNARVKHVFINGGVDLAVEDGGLERHVGGFKVPGDEVVENAFNVFNCGVVRSTLNGFKQRAVRKEEALCFLSAAGIGNRGTGVQTNTKHGAEGEGDIEPFHGNGGAVVETRINFGNITSSESSGNA